MGILLICTKCNQQKETKEFFKRNATGTKGFNSWCKLCLADKQRQRLNRYRLATKLTPTIRLCIDCKQEKQSTLFAKNKATKTGIACVCKQCAAIRMKQYQKTIEGKFSQYKNGAKRRELSFNLLLDKFSVLFYGACAYCNLAPARGVDRVDSQKGYEQVNCVSCCELCNWMKRSLSRDEFINHVKRIANCAISN